MDASYTSSQHNPSSEHDPSSPIQQSHPSESADGNGNGYSPSSPSPAVGQQLESEPAHPMQQQRSVGGGGNEGLSAGQIARKKLMGYVGFANLPNQVHRKRCVHICSPT
jgi:hypothetical protein